MLPERMMVTSPSVALHRSADAMYIQDPAYSLNFRAYTDVFKLEVWMSVGLAYLAYSLILYTVTQ